MKFIQEPFSIVEINQHQKKMTPTSAIKKSGKKTAASSSKTGSKPVASSSSKKTQPPEPAKKNHAKINGKIPTTTGSKKLANKKVDEKKGKKTMILTEKSKKSQKLTEEELAERRELALAKKEEEEKARELQIVQAAKQSEALNKLVKKTSGILNRNEGRVFPLSISTRALQMVEGRRMTLEAKESLYTFASQCVVKHVLEALRKKGDKPMLLAEHL